MSDEDLSVEIDKVSKAYQAEIERLRAALDGSFVDRAIANAPRMVEEIEKVRAAEREACARVADEYSKICFAQPTSVIDNVCRGIAAAIRARGESDG